jgi:hypothetical protein
MGFEISLFTVQPPIAKARTTLALRSHGACIGVELTLAVTGFIDYRRTLTYGSRRSINYLKPARKRVVLNFHPIIAGQTRNRGNRARECFYHGDLSANFPKIFLP